MSNPTELPDLDNLEAQARAADQDGQHIYTNPRDSNNWRANEIWHYLASPAAVLALIALARRAQPEGEAPPAGIVAWYRDEQVDANEDTMTMKPRYFTHRALSKGAGRPPGEGWRPLVEPAATLSPLCGAQHAESGKEATVKGGDVYRWYAAYCEESEKLKAARGCIERYKALAAQQAAAPGAPTAAWLIEWETATGGKRQAVELHNFAGDIRQAHGNAVVTELIARPTSAPGTPEAPKPPFPISDDEMAALRRFWECATDGEGYDVEKPMMQRLAEMGLVQRKSGAYYMATDFGLYVLGEYTIQRAAQLDGGQEGSGSNG